MASISGQAPLIKIYLKHYNMDNNTNKKEVDMDYSLKDIIAIKTSTDVANYLKSHTGFSLNEKNITFENVAEHFRYVGDNASNYSTIHILKNGEKGVVERITNAIDAVLEKNSNLVSNPVVASDIVSKAFPKWFENPVTPTGKNSAGDASNAVQVVFNDGSKNRPTIDIIDKGTGIMGVDFSKTILSLHGGNKINKSKSYLTGAFGHGGSTSLGFTNATLIISKCNGQYFFTIVKSCDFADSKLASYVYMIDNGNIPVANNDIVLDESIPNEIKMFIDSESGTFVRMIELDASSEWKSSNIGDHIFDYFNTELYNPCIPVKLIERRAVYSGTGYKNNANRFVFGAARSLDGSKFYHKDKSTLNRDQALEGILENGYCFIDDDPKSTFRRVFGFTGDEKIRDKEGNILPQYRQKIDEMQADIWEQLSEADRAYIQVVYKLLNQDCKHPCFCSYHRHRLAPACDALGNRNCRSLRP